MPTISDRAPSLSVPAVLALTGGLMIVAGSLLPWIGVKGGFASAGDVAGVDSWQGKVTLVCGMTAFAVGFLSLRGGVAHEIFVRVALASGAVAASLILLVSVSPGRLVPGSTVAAIARQAGVPPGEVFSTGSATVTVEAGAFVVLAGALLSLAACLLSHVGGGAASARSEVDGRREPD